ncbi:hypothetical protein HDU97_004918 [Phlyctochytrium planicorne]|nr:hypothetical protein HDU97_004918 [Phlyctochytrium planicorne]
MSNQLISRAFQVVPALMIRAQEESLLLARADSTCQAPSNYYCCPDNSNYACENGYDCDVANKQCIKKANVALIAGIVVALVVIIGACVGGCLWHRKNKRAKAMAATGGRM